jgi:hypothetical protein
MTMTQSNSAGKVNAVERACYLYDLFKMRFRGRGKFNNTRNLERIKEYAALSSKHGINLQSSQILEIGVGQRPYLGITFVALKYWYTGIDLEQPIYPPSLQKFVAIYRSNGFLRLLKTLIRYFLFDRAEYTRLLADLGISSNPIKMESFFLQADASAIDFARVLHSPATLATRKNHAPSQPPLVVISESVFEHIPIEDLSRILLNLRRYAEDAGRSLLILTRPTVFTGICGSHLTEWYHHKVYSTSSKASEPWEHLRKQRFVADTYLNKLSRAQYRELFMNAGFLIAAETVEKPGLGAEFLQDSALREELSEFSDEELLSNEVMFELVPSSIDKEQ